MTQRFRPRLIAALTIGLGFATPALVYGDWRIDPSFRPRIEGFRSFLEPTSDGSTNAGVFAIAPAPEGKVVVAGGFTKVNGVARPQIARLNADGTLDTTFNPTTPRTTLFVTLAVQSDGKILAGSYVFGNTTPVAEPTLVRYNTDGSLDPSFAPIINNVGVQSLGLMDDGRIMVGLLRGTSTGSPVVRLLPNGDVDSTFPDLAATITGPVMDLHVLPDNKTILAALFASSFPARYGALRLTSQGAPEQEFLTTWPGWVMAVSGGADGSTAFLATLDQGRPVPTLYLFDANGTKRFERENFAAQPLQLWDAVLRDPEATIAGSMLSSDNHTLERFTDTGARDPGFSIELANGAAHDVVFDSSGRVLVGGEFTAADGMAYRGAFRLIPDTPSARLANISTRGFVGEGHDVLIAGFVVAGTNPQRVLIRGVAENLADSGLAGLATDVRLSVYRGGDSTPVYEIESAAGSSRTSERIGAFPFGDETTTDDAAVALQLAPGSYTVHAQAKNPGIALVEVYDANGIQANRRLVNLSTRGRVGTGDERLIAGFVIDRGTKRVLIRAVGPGIANLVPGTLADPSIELVRQTDGAPLDRNDNWSDAPNAADIAATSSQVAGLQLAHASADAALLVELPAGAYSVVVSGADASEGIALVEVYEIP